MNILTTQTMNSNQDYDEQEDFNGNLSDRETSPVGIYRNYLSKQVTSTHV